MVLAYRQDYSIDYPIAFDIEFINNNKSRIARLTKAEKTSI